ncbi:universal stress protein [Nocardioides jensenii]|uniref:universal stress protein n=1 Tax=Nocardioides jensenii TaxID=1843 RepID=UPI00082BFEB2|nr:universal stress protein [Nocardioides jensenii]
MSIVVGFGPDVRSTAGLRLAGQLASTTGLPLVLCCVVHDAFDAPGLRDAHHVDAEWRAHLNNSAREAIAAARDVLPADVTAETVVRTGRSVPQVLRDEGVRRKATLLVAGSATVGSLGRIALGSTTDRLVHSSAVPVALAPRGYQDDGAVRRIVLAMEPTRGDVALAEPVAALAASLGAEVEVVTFLVRQRSANAAFASGAVIRAWHEEVTRAHREFAELLGSREVSVTGARVAEGDGWNNALRVPDWQPGDLLVVGSSHHGPVASVFLGSTAARILRHSPVPVIVLPRLRGQVSP